MRREIWITGVINEMGNVSISISIDRKHIGTASLVKVIQVKKVGLPDGVVVQSTSIGLGIGDDFSDVFQDKRAFGDELYRFHTPSAIVVGTENEKLAV